MLIRPETSEDFATVFSVHEQAFQRPDEGRLVEKIRQLDGYIPELSLVAVENGNVVGHILFSRIHVDTENGLQPILTLAPMAVLPEFQKSGVGGQLIRAGIEKARQSGWKGIVVLGHPTYYPRFGFEPASEYGLESPFPLNDPGAFMVLELSDGELDDMSGTVVYPEVFSEID